MSIHKIPAGCRDEVVKGIKKMIAFDDVIQKELKAWLKKNDRWKQYAGDVKNWSNVNRQLNRIIADAEGREVQRRSGTKTIEKWLYGALKDFLYEDIVEKASGSMQGKHGGSGVVVGVPEPLECENISNIDRRAIRGKFNKLSDARNFIIDLVAVIPYPVALHVNGVVYIKM